MVQRRALCHGDFRIGNFIVGDDGLRAVLDWELSSIGDPAQDLGWLCVRSWRFAGKGACGGFTSREAFLAAYLAQGGVPITLADVLYWEAFGNVRWALHCVRRGLRQGDAGFTIEDAAVGRRLAEPLHDFFDLVTTYGP
ncbi:Phosphotransferase enzyme family protein [compost metagenome]